MKDNSLLSIQDGQPDNFFRPYLTETGEFPEYQVNQPDAQFPFPSLAAIHETVDLAGLKQWLNLVEQQLSHARTPVDFKNKTLFLLFSIFVSTALAFGAEGQATQVIGGLSLLGVLVLVYLIERGGRKDQKKLRALEDLQIVLKNRIVELEHAPKWLFTNEGVGSAAGGCGVAAG